MFVAGTKQYLHSVRKILVLPSCPIRDLHLLYFIPQAGCLEALIIARRHLGRFVRPSNASLGNQMQQIAITERK